MVILTILAFLWMKNTAFGRSLYAIGGNAEAARAAGIPVERRTVQVFMIHGAFAGIATMLFATQLKIIQSTVPPNLELTIITASVIGGVSILGGTGTVIGSTLAAILFAAIGSAMIFVNVSAYWLRAVIGVLILVTVLVDMARRNREFRSASDDRCASSSATRRSSRSSSSSRSSCSTGSPTASSPSTTCSTRAG